jgi:hypothetical protein
MIGCDDIHCVVILRCIVIRCVVIRCVVILRCIDFLRCVVMFWKVLSRWFGYRSNLERTLVKASTRLLEPEGIAFYWFRLLLILAFQISGSLAFAHIWTLAFQV